MKNKLQTPWNNKRCHGHRIQTFFKLNFESFVVHARRASYNRSRHIVSVRIVRTRENVKWPIKMLVVLETYQKYRMTLWVISWRMLEGKCCVGVGVILLRGYRRRPQRDVVYLGWPITPSYMSPNAGGGGGGLGIAGSHPMRTAVHMEPI